MNTATLLHNYVHQPGIWDEMFDEGDVRPEFQKIVHMLRSMNVKALENKDRQASELFMNQGVTFTVYSDKAGIERIFPFDIIPRIITNKPTAM